MSLPPHSATPTDPAYRSASASALLWGPPLQALRQHLQQCQAHPARTVVLVPYAQLMGQAQYQWARIQPDGFAPRFETTRNWAQRLGSFIPEGLDFSQNMARDSFTASALLQAAGLGAQREVLLSPLLEAAAQLAPQVAAIDPAQRDAWLQGQRTAFNAALHSNDPDDPSTTAPAQEAGALRWESAIARLALEWLAASRHATDVLFAPSTRAGVDVLVVLQGFQPDPLAQALRQVWGENALWWPLYRPFTAPPHTCSPLPEQGYGHIALHSADDAEDEAQRAAACVLAHVQAGRTPVALASMDRALVRRISALIQSSGLQPKDENGWILSTTRAGARVMSALRACTWNASTDAVLDWLKHVVALPESALRPLERWLRRHQFTHWSDALRQPRPRIPEPLWETVERIEAWRGVLRSARPLAQWLQALRQLLQQTQQWDALRQDKAGERVLLELHLQEGLEHALSDLSDIAQPQPLAHFTRWVNQVLEAARYKPVWDWSHPAEVVILPLPQLLARPFAALVLPGCDEKRLPLAPEPPGQWSRAEREMFALPTRQSLQALQRAAWDHALQIPWVDVLWRTSEGGEAILASALLLQLQAWQQWGQAQHPHRAWPLYDGTDPRPTRPITPQATQPPQPSGAALPIAQLSASAYHDLRDCPYRFYALRQLGLQVQEELEAVIDKRDFGSWLHEVLQRFHHALSAQPTQDVQERRQYMNHAADQAQQALGLNEGEFLPYRSSWPPLREGYLRWLATHEATGAQFFQAEAQRQALLPLAQGALTLVGQIDRIDHIDRIDPINGATPAYWVLDYKTESEDRTKKRIQAGSEDTQLAFYAALMPDAGLLRAGYVHVGEKGTTTLHEAPTMAALRQALIDGIRSDFDRIAQGVPLRALGQGSACDWCNVRGLCRRDFWECEYAIDFLP